MATDRNFTDILLDYNNKNVGNVTSVAVSGDGINPATTYYYRVRAVNTSGQSLSSNRISTDLPIWIKNALEASDYAHVKYDAEENKISFDQDVKLKDTLVLQADEATIWAVISSLPPPESLLFLLQIGRRYPSRLRIAVVEAVSLPEVPEAVQAQPEARQSV